MVRTGVRRWKHFRCLSLIGVDAILKTVSVHECKPLDQATLAALDLQTVAVGLLSHPRLADTLGDSVAVLGHFARAFGREQQNRARQCRAQ